MTTYQWSTWALTGTTGNHISGGVARSGGVIGVAGVVGAVGPESLYSQCPESLDPHAGLEPISTSFDHPVTRVLHRLEATHSNAVATDSLTRSAGTLKPTSKGATKAQGAGRKNPKLKGSSWHPNSKTDPSWVFKQLRY